jgi:hypothetical protein
MASRPFGSVLVELDHSTDVFASTTSGTNPNSREEAHIRRRRRVSGSF